MEHMIAPPRAQGFSVPVVCKEPWDGGDFFGYLARQGWTFNDIISGKKSPSEIESIIQSYLYFGCIVEVLRINGLSTNAEVFINQKDRVVTTTKLRSCLSAVRSKYPRNPKPKCNCKQLPTPKCREKPCWRKFQYLKLDETLAGQKTFKILRELLKFVKRYCAGQGQGIRISGFDLPKHQTVAIAPVPIPVRPEILLSIATLGSCLSDEFFEIYDCSPNFDKLRWPIPPLLSQRLVEVNWCPAYIEQAIKKVKLPGFYYLAVRPKADMRNHKNCTDSACIAEELFDVLNAEPLHVVSGCTCAQVRTPEDELLRILRDGKRPIIRLAASNNSGECVLEVIALSEDKITDDIDPLWIKHNMANNPGLDLEMVKSRMELINPKLVTKYVAMSHVWSDRLGNQHANSLPRCQVLRIQNMVDEMNFEGRNSITSDIHVPFWMDTFCIPVKPEHSKLRDQCILDMYNIYNNAAAVLVLDSGIQTVPFSASVYERSAAIYQCNWNRRLWTFQEAYLAKEVHIRFKDRSLSVTSLLEETKHLNFDFIDFISIGKFALLREVQFYQDIKGENKFDGVYLPLTDVFQLRKCTRRADETLCVSVVLDVDVTPLVQIEEDDQDRLADRRMEITYRNFEYFSRSLLFHSSERLKTDGYRWAPRSFVGCASGALTDRSTFGRSEQNVRFTDNKNPETCRLHVMYDGLKLGLVTTDVRDEFMVVARGVLWKVVLEDHWVEWEPDSQYYIILYKSVFPQDLESDSEEYYDNDSDGDDGDENSGSNGSWDTEDSEDSGSDDDLPPPDNDPNYVVTPGTVTPGNTVAILSKECRLEGSLLAAARPVETIVRYECRAWVTFKEQEEHDTIANAIEGSDWLRGNFWGVR